MSPVEIEKLRAEVIDPRELSAAERQRWSDLMAADNALDSPFFAHAYVRAVAECRPGVRVAVIERAGEIIAFFPFQWRSNWHRLLHHAEPVGAHMTDAFGIVAEAAVVLPPLQLLNLSGIDYLFFTHLPEAQRRFGLYGDETTVGLAIDLEMGPTRYWEEIRRRNRALIRDAERRTRRLVEQHGPLTFVCNEADLERGLARLVEYKMAQYRRTGVRNVFARAWTIDLLRRLSQSVDPDCSGLLSSLYAGDRWVAGHFGLRRKGVLHYWFPVYDAELAAFAPGRLLLRALIDQSSSIGLRRIDRGIGKQKSKREFANKVVDFSTGVWRRSGSRALISRAAMSLAWRTNRFRVKTST